MNIIRIIIAINIAVFLLWNITGSSEPVFMIQNFLVSWSALAQGRFWTLLTSVFSHNMSLHIFINMYVLYGFGSVLERILGWRSFLKFYLLAGIISSLSHCLVSAWLLQNPDLPALGASGAISGVILVFALTFPRQKLFLFGLIPLPAFLGALAFIGLDLWGLVAQASGGGLPIGHGAHLGGAITGIFYYFLFLRRRYLVNQHY